MSVYIENLSDSQLLLLRKINLGSKDDDKNEFLKSNKEFFEDEITERVNHRLVYFKKHFRSLIEAPLATYHSDKETIYIIRNTEENRILIIAIPQLSNNHGQFWLREYKLSDSAQTNVISRQICKDLIEEKGLARLDDRLRNQQIEETFFEITISDDIILYKHFDVNNKSVRLFKYDEEINFEYLKVLLNYIEKAYGQKYDIFEFVMIFCQNQEIL